METSAKTVIHVENTVNLPVTEVWKYWTQPEHITQWNNASGDWHTPWAKNDLRAGGRFTARMEARDGSMGFEFGGVYDQVAENEKIAYTLDDGRKVTVLFNGIGNSTKVEEDFEAENMHPAELQRSGWQAILDNFKKYAESR